MPTRYPERYPEIPRDTQRYPEIPREMPRDTQRGRMAITSDLLLRSPRRWFFWTSWVQIYPIGTKNSIKRVQKSLHSGDSGGLPPKHLFGSTVLDCRDRRAFAEPGAYTNLHKPTQTYTNLHKPTQTYTNLHKPTQTYTNPHKPTQTYFFSKFKNLRY